MNKKCQIFTPNDYVEELLDSVGYIYNLYGKKILENACGDGNILLGIVQRYIDDCRDHDFSDTKIKEGIESDIYGIEIDSLPYKKCIENLDELLKKKGIGKVNWNIINKDYLRWEAPIKFHYVVGNPPYITYKELKEKEQNYVKEHFETCEKGKFDYCYAFIEKSIKELGVGGKMAYLIPSSIFKTVFGENLRNFMKPYIQEIKDYTQEKMFNNALVKSAIMVLCRNRQDNRLHYLDMTTNQTIDIVIDNLGGKWFFTNNLMQGARKFGDYFQVAHVVATLFNKAYVLKEEDYKDWGGYYECNGHRIEKEIVKETATPRSLRYNNKEKIIFPYSYDNGKLVRYKEEQFLKKFPGASEYLSKYRKQLDGRKSDNNSEWFEYGRSQALAGLNQRKLLISTIITDKVTVYTLEKECIPYAGMYIVPRDGNEAYKLEDAKVILESSGFIQYVRDVGIHISGSSLRITSKDIQNFKF